MTKQQKAAKARADNAAQRIWNEVQNARKARKCSCRIRKGMTYDDLRKLGGGCTDTAFNPNGRYVCPVLDKYRRLVGFPKAEEA